MSNVLDHRFLISGSGGPSPVEICEVAPSGRGQPELKIRWGILFSDQTISLLEGVKNKDEAQARFDALKSIWDQA